MNMALQHRHWRLGGFDLDGTLITDSTVLLHVGRHLGRSQRVTELVQAYESYKLSNFDVTIEAAEFFRGLTRDDLLEMMDDIPRLGDIGEAVSFLRSRNVRIVVATVSFAFAAEWFALKYGFDNYYGIVLEFDATGRATGRVVRHATEDGKAEFLASECAGQGIPLSEFFYVGDSRSDIPSFKTAGFAIALNATREAKAAADASIDSRSLRETLTLVPGLAAEIFDS